MAIVYDTSLPEVYRCILACHRHESAFAIQPGLSVLGAGENAGYDNVFYEVLQTCL